jgi:hypothetical protein
MASEVVAVEAAVVKQPSLGVGDTGDSSSSDLPLESEIEINKAIMAQIFVTFSMMQSLISSGMKKQSEFLADISQESND